MSQRLKAKAESENTPRQEIKCLTGETMQEQSSTGGKKETRTEIDKLMAEKEIKEEKER